MRNRCGDFPSATSVIMNRSKELSVIEGACRIRLFATFSCLLVRAMSRGGYGEFLIWIA